MLSPHPEYVEMIEERTLANLERAARYNRISRWLIVFTMLCNLATITVLLLK